MMERANITMVTGRMGYWGHLALAAALAISTVWAGKTPPDAGGYTATDAAGYSFIDLTVSGGSASVLANQDDGLALLTMPFPFTFYGASYTLLCVSSNGLAYFVTGSAACAGISDFQNADLTTTAAPGNLPAVIPYWTDLLLQGGGAVYYQTQGVSGGRKLIVQWSNAYPQATVLSGNPVTFELVLYETSNQILFQYKTANLGPANPASQGAQSTVGICDAGGGANGRATQWSFDAAVLSDSTAILFAPSAGATAATHFFVTVPASVTAPAAVNVTVAALDATNSLVPTYGGTVHFTSSDSSAALPADSTLSNGLGTFPVVLQTGGNQTITATDQAASLTGVSNTIAVTAFSKCDINQDNNVNVVDVQLVINEALGVATASHDLNTDGTVNVVDVQIVINAALGLGCAAK
jgi:hypothetical protein